MARVFVFGSNRAGRHGAGAAKFALKNHGAIWGCGVGLQGGSYGIPTKDSLLEVLPIFSIKVYVVDFLIFALDNPTLEFDVTRIGCGLAGFRDEQIAPMFSSAPSNCYFPTEWAPYLGPSCKYHDLH